MEVAFVFPLPYDGAIDQLTLLVDGKEFPAKLLPAKEARDDLRRHRPQEPGPGPAGMDGHRHVPDQRLPGAAGRRAEGDAALHAALRQGPRADRFPVPAVHGQVHVAAGREGRRFNVAIEATTEIKNVYSPTHAVEHQAARQQARDRHVRSDEHSPDERLPPALRRRPTASSARACSAIGPTASDDGYFLLLASPEIKAADDERAARRR